MSAPGNVRQAAKTSTSWATPAQIFDKLNDEFHFGLDAAADDDNTKVPVRYLTGPCIAGLNGPECWCGLCTRWSRMIPGTHSAWVNPPYGRGLYEWVSKCSSEAFDGNITVVALLPDSLDTSWFRWVFATAWEIRIVVGRIQFDGTTSSNPCGSVIAVWRPGRREYGQPVFSMWDQPSAPAATTKSGGGSA